MSLRNETDEVIIHVVTNDIPDNIKYLTNAPPPKKNLKLVRKTSRKLKLCFFSIICRTYSKNIDGKIKEVNSHLENYPE